MNILLITAILFAGATAPSAPPKIEPADAGIILDWLLGGTGRGAFHGKFGDAKLLAGAKDLVLYSDLSPTDYPRGVKAVPYDVIQARMSRLRAGHKPGPAVVLTRSTREDPAEGDTVREERKRGDALGHERYYYVEVAIGNLAWHWMKIAVGESDGKPKAVVLWQKVS